MDRRPRTTSEESRAVHIVIMGCGRVGSSLAMSLEHLDHAVAIIDQNPEAFRRLPANYAGDTVSGIGFDRDTLLAAGIERAGGFAAVSSGDNSNIIAARVARETFGVENVVARIYDPRRAAVYQRLGIPTVATVKWAADNIIRRLLPGGYEALYRDPSGQVTLAEMHLDPGWIGQRVSRLEQASGARVMFLSRFGDGMVPTVSTVLQEGDLVHIAAESDRLAAVADVVGSAPEEG